jgi:hypothetical protein
MVIGLDDGDWIIWFMIFLEEECLGLGNELRGFLKLFIAWCSKLILSRRTLLLEVKSFRNQFSVCI